MITKTMKKFLEEEYPDLIKKKGSIKLAVYLGRIQKRIEKQMEMMLWLAVNKPDIFLDKQITFNEYGNIHRSRDHGHERLKMLMLAIKALRKNVEVELVKNEQDS